MNRPELRVGYRHAMYCMQPCETDTEVQELSVGLGETELDVGKEQEQRRYNLVRRILNFIHRKL